MCMHIEDVAVGVKCIKLTESNAFAPTVYTIDAIISQSKQFVQLSYGTGIIGNGGVKCISELELYTA